MNTADRDMNAFYHYLPPFSNTHWPRDAFDPHSTFKFRKCFTQTSETTLEAFKAVKNDEHYKSAEISEYHSQLASISSHNMADTTRHRGQFSTPVNAVPNFNRDFSPTLSNSNLEHDNSKRFPFSSEFHAKEKNQVKAGYDDEKDSHKSLPFEEQAVGDLFRKRKSVPSDSDRSAHEYKERHDDIQSQYSVGFHNSNDDSRYLNFEKYSRPHIKPGDRKLNIIDHKTKLEYNNDDTPFQKREFDNTEDRQRTNTDSFASDCLVDKSPEFRMYKEEANNLAQTKSGITVTLVNSSLWRAFHEIGTEMIINRSGRRMFPYLALSVKGLDPDRRYDVSVQIVSAVPRRFKYINMKWIAVGLADSEALQMPSPHQDSPNAGAFWNNSKITFSKIKLTNNLDSAPQNILLHSMHKYKLITTVTLLGDLRLDKTSVTFTFPETDFMAVTAYQNEAVTQMKIHNNPFAKAFRDVNFSSIRRSVTSRKRKHGSHNADETKAPTPPRVAVSPVHDVKPGNDNLLTSIPLSPHLPSVNSYYSLGDAASGLRSVHTPPLLGLGNLSYCLPWGGFSIVPSPLCSRLLPFPSPRLYTDFPEREDLLKADKTYNYAITREALSKTSLQADQFESPSPPTIDTA